MPITSDTWWEIRCDGCGDTFPDNDAGGTWLAQSEEEAREMVTDYDGEIRDGKVICPGCIDEEGDSDAR
jgi:formylmethanofuran dehydrogenase subunit E